MENYVYFDTCIQYLLYADLTGFASNDVIESMLIFSETDVEEYHYMCGEDGLYSSISEMKSSHGTLWSDYSSGENHGIPGCCGSQGSDDWTNYLPVEILPQEQILNFK